MTRDELQKVRDWVDGKLAAGQEPPWAWFQYMKLRETLDQILAGTAATTTENSPQSEERPGAHLRLVGATCLPNSVQSRCDPVGTVQLPM